MSTSMSSCPPTIPRRLRFDQKRTRVDTEPSGGGLGMAQEA
jgi:hypothetical protein